jgi:hypothetical protein
MAGICFWMLMFPIDSIKSRIQVFQPNMSTMKYTLEIIKNEGNQDLINIKKNNTIIYFRSFGIICWFIPNSTSYFFCYWYFIHYLWTSTIVTSSCSLISFFRKIIYLGKVLFIFFDLKDLC